MSSTHGVEVAKALKAADWSGVNIGNKALVQAAIGVLESQAELLGKARSCVSYQAGMQNLNTEAGQNHAARLNELLERIDAAVPSES